MSIVTVVAILQVGHQLSEPMVSLKVSARFQHPRCTVHQIGSEPTQSMLRHIAFVPTSTAICDREMFIRTHCRNPFGKTQVHYTLTDIDFE
jgi:hypothetical protein